MQARSERTPERARDLGGADERDAHDQRHPQPLHDPAGHVEQRSRARRTGPSATGSRRPGSAAGRRRPRRPRGGRHAPGSRHGAIARSSLVSATSRPGDWVSARPTSSDAARRPAAIGTGSRRSVTACAARARGSTSPPLAATGTRSSQRRPPRVVARDQVARPRRPAARGPTAARRATVTREQGLAVPVLGLVAVLARRSAGAPGAPPRKCHGAVSWPPHGPYQIV